MCTHEILQEIPDEDLPALRDLYKSQQDIAPHVFNLLNICIDWKKNGTKTSNRIQNSLVFYGTKNDWLKSGAFFVLLEYSCYDLFFYTLRNDCKKLYKAITETKQINWNKRPIWFTIASSHIATVVDIAKNVQPPNYELLGATLWVLEEEKALQLDTSCPENVYLRRLDKSHASLVDKHWKYRLEGSEEYLQAFIEMNASFGVFLKSDDTLVCWVLLNHLGLISNLQTLPEYERKGYGTLVTKALSKEVARNGCNPVTCIMKGNVQSEKLFRRLGFRKYDDCMFVY